MEFVISDNKDLYKQFYEKKEAIESSVGIQLVWKELPDRTLKRPPFRNSSTPGLNCYQEVLILAQTH